MARRRTKRSKSKPRRTPNPPASGTRARKPASGASSTAGTSEPATSDGGAAGAAASGAAAPEALPPEDSPAGDGGATAARTPAGEKAGEGARSATDPAGPTDAPVSAAHQPAGGAGGQPAPTGDQTGAGEAPPDPAAPGTTGTARAAPVDAASAGAAPRDAPAGGEAAAAPDGTVLAGGSTSDDARDTGPARGAREVYVVPVPATPPTVEAPAPAGDGAPAPPASAPAPAAGKSGNGSDAASDVPSGTREGDRPGGPPASEATAATAVTGGSGASSASSPTTASDLEASATGPGAGAGDRAGGTSPATVPEDDATPPTRFGGPGGAGPGPRPPLSRQRAIRAALASLPVPAPGPSFWADLESALAEQQPFAITTRPAIRPITEPPPLSQPRLGDGLPGASPSRGRGRGGTSSDALSVRDLGEDTSGRGRRAVVVVVAVAIITALLVMSSVLGEDDDQVRARDATTTTAAPDELTTATTGPTTTTAPQVPGLEPSTALTAAGLGPLQVGLRGRDLEEEGVELLPDTSTFEGTGGRCYDVAVPGAPDVVLRFRSGDAQGVDDPLDGVLAAVSVTAQQGSTRLTDAGLGLGATAEQVQSAHTGAVEASAHPLGQVFVVEAPDGSGNGIAYVVDGAQVAEINVGALDAIPQPQTCT